MASCLWRPRYAQVGLQGAVISLILCWLLPPRSRGWVVPSRGAVGQPLARRAAQKEAGDDLDIDGELEDDWGVVDEEEAADDPLLEEYMQKMGYSPLDDQSEEDEEHISDMPLPPKIQERVDKAKARLEQFADPESLKAFDGVGGGGGEAIGWLEVPLNDTFSVFVSQVPGAANRFQEMLRGSPEVTNITTDILQGGDTVWPASIILARWLAIQPPVVSMEVGVMEVVVVVLPQRPQQETEY
eukprot:s7507_g6.t1